MTTCSRFEPFTEDQRLKVQELLNKNVMSFWNQKKTGQIESLKLKVNVTDPTPVCKHYRKITSCTPKWNNALRAYWEMSGLRLLIHLMLIPWFVWRKEMEVWESVWVIGN